MAGLHAGLSIDPRAGFPQCSRLSWATIWRGKEKLRHFVRSMTLTEACNLLGLPSVALPVMVTNGLPQGVQLIGGRFAEHLCLDAAEVIESAAGVFTPIEPCI